MFSKKYTTFTTLLVSAAVGLAGTPAAQAIQETPIVAQGDQISTVDGKGCTVGYNDLKNNRTYLASHCGDEGDTFTVLAHDLSNFWEGLGTFHTNANYSDGQNDFGYIQWAPGEVTLEDNAFSGNTVIKPGSLKKGDEVCFHGKSTHMNNPTGVTCGEYMGTLAGDVFVDFGTAGEQGDSGAPMWVPGKGFLGILSGDQYSILNGVQYKTRAIRGATFDKSGALWNSNQLSDLFAAYEKYRYPQAPLPTETPQDGSNNGSGTTTTAKPTPAPTTPKKPAPSKSGSSSSNGGMIAGIIAAIIAVLGALGIGGWLLSHH